MANRNFPSNKIYNMHVMPVRIDAQIAISGSGAPAAPTLASAAGVQAISRVSAGLYNIQLQDNYAKVIGMQVSFQSVSVSAASGIFVVELISFANSSNPANNNGATIQIRCMNAAGASTDPASGSVMLLVLDLNNSQVQ